MLSLYRCFLLLSSILLIDISVFASDNNMLIGEWKVKEAKLAGKPSDVCSYCDLFLNKTSIFFKEDGFVRYDKIETEVTYSLEGETLTFSRSNGDKITHKIIFQTNSQFKLFYIINNVEEEYIFTRIK